MHQITVKNATVCVYRLFSNLETKELTDVAWNDWYDSKLRLKYEINLNISDEVTNTTLWLVEYDEKSGYHQEPKSIRAYDNQFKINWQEHKHTGLFLIAKAALN